MRRDFGHERPREDLDSWLVEFVCQNRTSPKRETVLVSWQVSRKKRFHVFSIWVCLKTLCTPLYPMVLLIIIPMKNGYFIGNINPTFSDKPISFGNRSNFDLCSIFQDLRHRIQEHPGDISDDYVQLLVGCFLIIFLECIYVYI